MKKLLLLLLLPIFAQAQYTSTLPSGYTPFATQMYYKISGSDTTFIEGATGKGFHRIAKNQAVLDSLAAHSTRINLKVDKTTTINTQPLSSNITLTQDNIGDGPTYKQYSATDKAQLATNTSNIATNTSNIASNTTAIGTKADLGGNSSQDFLVGTTPVAANSAVSKNYFDNALTGITWKNAVRLKTTANITLSGTQTIDGVSAVAGNRILVNNQTDTTQNGIYIASAGAWTRATDADSGDELSTATVAVTLGTANKNTQWTCTVTGDIIVGTTAITFGQISGAGTYTNGSGIDLTANVFSLNSTYARGLLSAVSPLAYVSATGEFSMPAATSGQNGYLTSTDWSTFNGKQSAVSFGAIGSTANANGGTITSGVINLQPASASFGGVMTTGTQTIAGAKTLTSALTGTDATFNNMVVNTLFGVGIASPGASLHVYKSTNGGSLSRYENPNVGSSAFAGVEVKTDGGSSYFYRTSNAYTGGTLLADNTVIQEAGGGDIVFFGASEAARIKNNGNLQIGTPTPTAGAEKLQVAGAISQTSVTSSIVKANATGVITAAVAGTDYQAPPVSQALTDGATITWNINSGGIATVTLGGNRTLAITNPVANSYYQLTITQDGTGSRTITLPAGSKVIGGGAGAVTLTTTAGAKDILSCFYDGSAYYWNLGLNYN